MISRFLSLLILIFIVLSCCHEQNDSSGVIVSDYKIGDYYEGIECLETPDTACIRDESTYKAMFILDTTSNNCKGLTLLNVDFTKYSILINHKQNGGRIFFHRNVTVDSVNKLVTFQITTTSCFCPDKCVNTDLNIVLVPKIDKTFKIIYK
jgi:hypothetical protein